MHAKRNHIPVTLWNVVVVINFVTKWGRNQNVRVTKPSNSTRMTKRVPKSTCAYVRGKAIVSRCATNKEKEDVVIVLMGSNCRKMEPRVKKSMRATKKQKEVVRNSVSKMPTYSIANVIKDM